MKFLSFLLFLILCGFSLSSFSKVTVLGTQGASYFDESQLIIYGGLSGDGSVCNKNSEGENSTLCDSCQSCISASCDCNERRIYPELVLRVILKSDSASGHVLVRTKDNPRTIRPFNSYPQNVKTNSSASASFYWRDLCLGLGSTSSCSNILPSTNTQTSILVGIDGNLDGDLSDPEDDSIEVKIRVYTPPRIEVPANCTESSDIRGLCNIVFTRGDRKAIITEILAHELYPVIQDDVEIDSIRIFLSETGFPEDASLNFVDIEAEGLKEITETQIEGLKNDVRHYFRFAIVDKAANVGFFQSRALFDSKCPDASKDCDYSVTPEEVFGFLKEDKNCFIATTTFGSNLHPHISVFREFRNEVLLKFTLGEKFVRSYYKWGSKAAYFIENNPVLKPFVRVLLWGLWIISLMALNPFLSGFLLLSLGLVFYFRKKITLIFFLGLGLFSSSGEANILKDKLFSFQAGFYSLNQLKNRKNESFVDFYDTTPVVFLVDYEIPLSKKSIQMGLKFGTGFTYNEGKGRFRKDNSEAQEKFYFFSIPNRASLIMRAKLPQSFLVPFVEAGGGYSFLVEKRSDGLDKTLGKQAGTATFHWAAGVALDLIWDQVIRNDLKEDYDLKLVYIYAEYRQILSARKDLDVGSKIFTVGFSFGI